MGGEPLGQSCLKRLPEADDIATSTLYEQGAEQCVVLWREVNGDRLSGTPVGGCLKHGGPAQTAVGDEQLFSKCWSASGLNCNVGRNAGELGPGLLVAAEQERDEGSSGRDNVEAELTRQVVCQASRAHLGYGQTASRKYQGGRLEFASGALNVEFAGSALDLDVSGVEADLHVPAVALRQQHVHDLAGRVIAEELA